MSYMSFEFFILYFGITYLLYWVFPKKAKWTVLLVGSFLFYLFASGGHFVFLILSTVVIWLTGLGIQKLNDNFNQKEKSLEQEEIKALKTKCNNYKLAILTVGVLFNVLFILVSKYANCFDLNNIAHFSIIEPLGISFYTLQAISYIVDVYRGKYKAAKNPLHLMLYLSFMLTVVKGPIARYDELGTQLVEGGKVTSKNFTFGAQLVIWGLFKKIVIADRAAEFVNNAFDQTAFDSGFLMLVAVLLYTLQFYCDFSGVMDVVNGLAEMMGIKMPKNFNNPFSAKTISDFWQRWHITLGAWLRDYVFYPILFSKPFMSISKKAKDKSSPYYASLIPTTIALLFAWIANGLWHGPAWKFIVFGLYYYVLMMLGLLFEPLSAKFCNKLKINRNGTVFGIFQALRTFVIVNLGMLIFRAESLIQLKAIIISFIEKLDFASIKRGTSNGMGLTPEDYFVLAGGFVLVLIVGIISKKGIDIREKLSKLPFIFEFVIFLGLLFTIIIFGAYGEGYLTADLPVQIFR